MAKAINEQINKEVFSAYMYQSMSAWATNKGLVGAANWFQVQVQEEMTHAQKFYNYVLQQGEEVTLMAIAAPPANFTSPKNAFVETLAHEKTITASINKLAALAQKEGDMATFVFLQWFITEQVEEESNVKAILDKIEIIGEQGPGFYMLDKELEARVFVPPTTLA